MREGQIIAKAICVFRKDDLILVAEGFDEVKGEFYYRPIGGKIEFGETSANALKREVLEEIEATINGLTYLGTVENIFTYNGDIGHEVVFVYDAEFVDKSFYEKPSFLGKEDNGETFVLLWKAIRDFTKNKSTLVPVGLFDVL